MRAMSWKFLVLVALVVPSACGGGRGPDALPGAAALPVPATSAATVPTTTSTTTTATTAPTTTTTQAPTTTTGRRMATPPSTAAPRPARAPAPLVSALLPPLTPPPSRDLTAYEGLGTWVDAYDFSPQYQPKGAPPAVTVDTIDQMAAEGVRTLYLQAAKDDARSPGELVNPELLGPMLVRAHDRGIRVVAWYLPKFYDIDSDLRRLVAMRDFRADGHGFDGIGVDIEWRADVPDVPTRNARLIELSRRTRQAMGDAALSAIPLPPVVMEVINKNYWPDFPWREIAPFYDVWLPQCYWTFRTQRSGYRDGYRYTEENIRRMRNNLGLPNAPVHALGGTDNRSTDADYRGFIRAAHDTRSLGASIYDWRTTPASAWSVLRSSPG
jgi:hypothetical protein